MTSPASHRLSSLFRLFDTLAAPLAQLLTRIVFGQAFLLAGYGKLQNLDRTIAFFEGLGIPAANLQAPFVAGVEFVGGILLLLGLGTRISALFLTVTMVVATLTAHLKDFAWDDSFAKIAPLPFLCAMLWLLAKGAGKLSCDHLLASRKAHG